MVNSADQLASDPDLQCLQRQGISGFSRTRVKTPYDFHVYFVHLNEIVCVWILLAPAPLETSIKHCLNKIHYLKA